MKTTLPCKNWKFSKYSRHYKEVYLSNKNEDCVVKLEGWLVDLLQEVRRETREDFKREVRVFFGGV